MLSWAFSKFKNSIHSVLNWPELAEGDIMAEPDEVMVLEAPPDTPRRSSRNSHHYRRSLSPLQTRYSPVYNTRSRGQDNRGHNNRGHNQPTRFSPRTPPSYNQQQEMIRNLQHRNAILERDYARAQNDLQMANEEVNGYANKLRATESRLHAVYAQLEKSQQDTKFAESEAAELRSIILEGVNTQKISDNDVKRDFSKLRQGIQKILGSSTLLITTLPDIPADGEDEEVIRAFYDSARWVNLGPQDRKRRLCGKIFAMLHNHILENKCFGLAGFERGANSPDVQIQITIQTGQTRFERVLDLGVTETGLQRFEKLLEERNVPGDVIQDWRVATIDCAEKCHIEATTSAVTAEKIFSLLEPLMLKSTDATAKEALRNLILSICRDAFAFAMLTRRSKDGYRSYIVVEDVDGTKSIEKNGQFAEPDWVESGQDDDMSDNIEYTLFGGLMKSPHDQERIILRKAQVVMRRKDQATSTCNVPIQCLDPGHLGLD
ncbi:hypothetical protein QBC34DRAFT_382682 [Podospora aff. communis PSN243]|uniref:Uncharacterized protein n=1 Tax=Podospora aff. communis PSN243 TaxID=3040156 RepID=A0AAV9GGQ9_9PEZI|nr:hypothetical protein QBC34DRAFT_382682 [Podospora aff. communis PSN243]